MVIQRLQTLYLFLAIAAMVVFLFVPFGFWDVDVLKANPALVDLTGAGYVAVLVPVIVSIVCMFVAILCFKKLPLQKSLVTLSIILVLAIACLVIYIMTRGFDVEVANTTVKPLWGGGGLLLVAALVALFGAHNRISHDQKLLRSYDRLR